MIERFAQLRDLLHEKARTLPKVEQVRSQGILAAQTEDSRKRFGDAWCGGEIEKSLRQVVQGGSAGDCGSAAKGPLGY